MEARASPNRAGASPNRAGASPAPNLGSGFTSAWLSPKGRGDPPGGRRRGGLTRPATGSLYTGKEMREPSGWPEGSEAATREGPVQNYLL